MGSELIPYKLQSEEVDVTENQCDFDNIQYQNVGFIQNRFIKQIKSRVKQWENMPDRKIIINKQDKEVPNNRIETAKYNMITFLPMNLIEQFSKFANIYFLMIGLLSMIKQISMTDGTPVIFLPLSFIIFITACKDFFEDLSRKKSDEMENNSKTQLLTKQGLVSCRWESLQIGDIIKVNNNEYFPADILLIKSSEKKGLAYIETKNLDGETNLKHKKVTEECQGKYSQMYDLEIINQRDKLEYEKPNPFIYNFNGNIQFQGDRHKKSLDCNQLALRGCSLRNTDFVYGVVVYTGEDTKIMLNSLKARAKQSKMMQQMNIYIVYVLILQIVFCFFAALINHCIFKYNINDLSYLYLNNQINFALNFFDRFGNWMIMFSNFVPISLLVILETVKYIQGQIIKSDYHFFSKKYQINAQVQSSSLNEELGQIQHIFSDKTGTLTQNSMEFRQIDIKGIKYGCYQQQEINQEYVRKYPSQDKVDFVDAKFMDILDRSESNQEYENIREYLMMLSLCHTILVTQVDGKNIYNASSPDEYALIQMALYCGFQYQGIDQDNNMLVYEQRHKKVWSYKLLEVLEFNSTRKRMSVILRDNQTKEIILYCKGADNIIYQRLSQQSKNNFYNTNQHLEEFAKVGLRTLLLGKRILSDMEYNDWKMNYILAQQDIQKKEQLMADVQEAIEVNLECIGATAIEDKLQDNVGETISYLKRAQIKVWVLTGDKQETAINIGYSCKLLDDTLIQIIVDAKDPQEIKHQMQELIDKYKNIDEQQEDCKSKYALIVSGESLLQIQDQESKKKLFKLSNLCDVVVACRVSPKQKAEIVNLVKEFDKDTITLAIGDGANDVNMINAAHVGIGIMGVEGNQAARASDYALGEFQYLRRLILVKGNQFYRRNSILICYNFWKNIILVIPTFFYGCYNMFSGSLLYDSFLPECYNVFYCNFPIIYYALHDKDVMEKTLLNQPHYYHDGRLSRLFNKSVFFNWQMNGIFYSSLVLFGFLYSVSSNFHQEGLIQYQTYQGQQILFIVIFLANTKVLLISNCRTPTQILIIFFSQLSYIFLFFSYSSIQKMSDIGYDYKNNLFSFFFHIKVLLIVGYCTIIDWSIEKYKYFQRISEKNIQKKIEEQSYNQIQIYKSKILMLINQLQMSYSDNFSDQNQEIKKSERRKYTGYAFSQIEKQQSKTLK